MAAKGNASSSFANAAVPRPWAAAPIPSPLAAAFCTPNASRMEAPKFAPDGTTKVWEGGEEVK